jgi:hypothetical protein
MIAVPEETKEKADRMLPGFEPRPPKETKKTRLAVSIRKGRLCYVPVTTREAEAAETRRQDSDSPAPPGSDRSS